MSPIAVGTPRSPTPSPGLKAEISRRPSPWSDLAHSLSESPLTLPPRRYSSAAPPTTGTAPLPHAGTSTESLSPITTSVPAPANGGPSGTPTSPSPPLSSSALREWERLLLDSSGVAKRHHLVHPHSRSVAPALQHITSNGSLSAPKLAAERDKEGHIEYKLKLIDPTPDRFERLVTQMLWRLKQGRNEAIYEIGLAGELSGPNG